MEELIKEIIQLSESEHSDISERYIKLSEEVGEVANELINIKNYVGDTGDLKTREVTVNTDFTINGRVITTDIQEEPVNEVKRELCMNISKEITDVLIRTIVLYSAIPGNTLETLKDDIKCKTRKLQYNISIHRL